MSSPLDILGFHKKVFKFFGMFQIETDSKKLKQLMEMYTVGYQVIFTDLGFLLFSLAVVESGSSKELLQILFVVIAYLNAVVKAFIFYLKRKHLEQIWSKLDDPDYMANDQIEKQWAYLLNINNWINKFNFEKKYNRFADSSKLRITKIINPYSCFGAINLLVAYLTPLMEWKKRLPYMMLVPFGFDKTNVGFYLMYIYQFGNVVYAGGTNIAVNMYLFSTLVCVDFFLLLLGCRVRRLGYPSGQNEQYTVTPKSKESFYREMCGCIRFHLKIDELVFLQFQSWNEPFYDNISGFPRLVHRIHELFNDLIFIQVVQSAFVLANSAILLIAVRFVLLIKYL